MTKVLSPHVKQPTVIDVFAGVGGLSLGAARAGFKVVLALEKDPHAVAAHSINFPLTKHDDRDVTSLSASEMLELAGLLPGELDGMVGGPPCQGFSTIGHRRVTDVRNNLFQKFFQLVSEAKPKFFVAENVLGILNEQYSKLRSEALDLVTTDYVVLKPLRLKATDFGAATIRERVFFIGYRRELVNLIEESDFERSKIAEKTTVSTALLGLPPRIRPNWIEEQQGWRRVSAVPLTPFFDKIVNGVPRDVGNPDAIRLLREKSFVSGCLGTRHSAKVTRRYDKLRPGEQDRTSKAVRLKVDGFCPTLRAGTDAERGSYQAVRPIHPTVARVITPREAARLQGFPDWFQFAPSKWHSFRQIGNSVSPLVAEAVLSVIKRRLELIGNYNSASVKVGK